MTDRDEEGTQGATNPQAPTVQRGDDLPRADRALAAGDRVGDYRVVRLLGRGGMGEVYLARDERLRRDIAIKVVRPGLAAGRDLLLHEAQAMARLAHPNVVTVYECGLVGDQVFVAMEYVDGTDLRRWLRAPRPWRDVLRAFVAAGHGLAAAHAAGLVHRDVKPDNILVGADGRIRIGDFGVAAGAAEGDAAMRAGTPAYMAPEQRDHHAADARSDQYAFAVALHEGLTGKLPSADPAGATTHRDDAHPAEALARGAGARPVPAWIRTILARALQPHPADRYPSMPALLDALGRDPALRRRRVGLALGALGLGALAVLGWTRGSERGPACRIDPHALDGAWDPSIEAALRARFHAAGRPYGDATADRVVAALDAHAAAWRAARQDACLATAVRHEQSAAVLDLRVQCLDRRAGELGALTALFATAADGEVVDRAVQAVAALPDLAACADTAALTEAIPPPPGEGARIAALRARIDAAAAQHAAGRYRDAVAPLTAIVTEARPLGYPQLLGEALRYLARAQLGAELLAEADATALEALRATALAHDDVGVAKAWRLRISIASQGGRYPEGLAFVAGADAAVARAGTAPGLEADLLLASSQLRASSHDNAGAKADAERAIALYQRAGADPIDHAGALNALMVALRHGGDYVGARRAATEALAIWERELGATHPRVAGLLMNLSSLDLETGAYAAAEEEVRRAIAIWEPVLGPAHGDVGRALTTLSQLLRLQQKFADARALGERALAIKLAALGAEHPAIATSLTSLGFIAYSAGDLAAARDYWQRGLDLRLRVAGPDDTSTAESLDFLGDLDEREGNLAAARARYERALAIWRKVNPPGHPLIARGLTSVTANAIDAGRFADAVTTGREALAILEAIPDVAPADLIRARKLVGRALIRLRRWDEADEVLTGAVAAADRTGTADLHALLDLGEVKLARGDEDAGRTMLDRAFALATAVPDARGEPAFLASRARFALAKLLWLSPHHRDRPRATALVAQAQADLDRVGPAPVDLTSARRELVVWRASHHR